MTEPVGAAPATPSIDPPPAPTRRTLLRAGVGALAAVPLAACSSSSARTTIRFKQNKPEVTGYFDKLVATFNDSQSRVRVVHDAAPTSIVAEFVRGAPPDIACYNYNLETSTYVAKGVLRDLAGLPEAKTIDPKYQSLVSQYANYHGQTNVLPYSVTAAGVIYNKQLFADAGVAVPTTFSELTAACETFKAAGLTPIFTTAKDVWTIQQGFFDYTTGSSINVPTFFKSLKSEGTDAGAVDATSFTKVMGPGLERALSLRQYFNTNWAARTYADGNLAMAQGKVAMYFQGPWALGEIATISPKLAVGTFPLPMTEDPADARARVNLDLAVWIPKATSKYAAAHSFLSYLMKPSVMNKYNADNTAFSPRIGAADPKDPRIVGLQPALDSNRIYQGAATYVPNTIPLGNYLQGAMLNGNGEKFLETLDTDWNRLAKRSA